MTFVLASRSIWWSHFVGSVKIPLQPDTGKRLLSGTADNSMDFIRTFFHSSIRKLNNRRHYSMSLLCCVVVKKAGCGIKLLGFKYGCVIFINSASLSQLP